MNIPYPTCYASNPGPQDRAEQGCDECLFDSQCAEAGAHAARLAQMDELGVFLRRAQWAVGAAPTLDSAHQAWIRLDRTCRLAVDRAAHLDLGRAAHNALATRNMALKLEELAGEAGHAAGSLWPSRDYIPNVQTAAAAIGSPLSLEEGLAWLMEDIEGFRNATFVDLPNPANQHLILGRIAARAFLIHRDVLQLHFDWQPFAPEFQYSKPVSLPRPVTIAPLALARFQAIEDAAAALLEASQPYPDRKPDAGEIDAAASAPELLWMALRSALVLAPANIAVY